MSQQLQTEPPIRLYAAFHDCYPSDNPAVLVQAPQRELWVMAGINSSGCYSVSAPDFDAQTTFSYQSAKHCRTVTNRPLPSWARYPAGVAVLLLNAGYQVDGLCAAFVGEEPLGPRYDYSIGIAFAALWYEVMQIPVTPATLAEIVDCVCRDYLNG